MTGLPPEIGSEKDNAACVDRVQVTISQGEMLRHGFLWLRGDRFRYRVWLALKLLDNDAAKLYFRTTRDG